MNLKDLAEKLKILLAQIICFDNLQLFFFLNCYLLTSLKSERKNTKTTLTISTGPHQNGLQCKMKLLTQPLQCRGLYCLSDAVKEASESSETREETICLLNKKHT